MAAKIQRTDETPLQTEPEDGRTQPCYNPTEGPYSKKVDELEALLENLQGKLSNVVAHIDYVKKIREELCVTAQTLQKGPESLGESPNIDEKQQKKLKEILFEIKTREQVLNILEKKELVLSHAVLSVVSNWADEMEKSLEIGESNKSLQEDHVQSYSEPSHITTN